VIKCFKISSGEEIIGNVTESTETHVTIDDVASVLMMPGGAGGQRVQLGLAPFLPYSEDGKFTINKSYVIVEFEPNTDMINNYNRIFGSGIQIAR
jgi:hypothetical protein